MKRIKVIGAGQLGSRHLQALNGIRETLDIHVVDPSADALKVAQERFNAAVSDAKHHVTYSRVFEKTDETDIAIVATNSRTRRAAVEQLLQASPVKYLLLEKLLFSRPSDYQELPDLLASHGTAAWVNCPMRMMPTYETIRKSMGAGPISYRVSGSNFGLVTNAIHYIDHLVHLCGTNAFSVDHTELDRTPINSKRQGYLELNGTLRVRFGDGSTCEMTCYPTGDAPVLVEIFTPTSRHVVRESEARLWQCDAANSWRWTETEARIPYQSEMTTQIVRSLFEHGACPLTPLQNSITTHLQLLNGLMPLVRAATTVQDEYPFT